VRGRWVGSLGGVALAAVSDASTAFSVEGDDEQVAAGPDGSSREHQPDTQPVEVGLPVTATEGRPSPA